MNAVFIYKGYCMPTQEQIRKYSLIGALVLPIFLIGAVWLSHKSPAALSPPPHYDLIYSIPENHYEPKRLIEENGNLVMTTSIRGPNEPVVTREDPKLYRYDVSTKTAHLLAFEVKEPLTSTKHLQKMRVEASQISGFIPGKVAPDGYAYERRYSRHGWLAPFRSYSHVHHTIVKDKNVLVFLQNRSSVEFIGWIETKGLNHE